MCHETHGLERAVIISSVIAAESLHRRPDRRCGVEHSGLLNLPYTLRVPAGGCIYQRQPCMCVHTIRIEFGGKPQFALRSLDVPVIGPQCEPEGGMRVSKPEVDLERFGSR